jgi:hypothetical protein
MLRARIKGHGDEYLRPRTFSAVVSLADIVDLSPDGKRRRYALSTEGKGF